MSNEDEMKDEGLRQRAARFVTDLNSPGVRITPHDTGPDDGAKAGIAPAGRIDLSRKITPMTTEALRTLVESHRATLNEMTGQSCEFSANGPVSMYVVDALVDALEAQQKQIDELRSSLSRAGLTILSPFPPPNAS